MNRTKGGIRSLFFKILTPIACMIVSMIILYVFFTIFIIDIDKIKSGAVYSTTIEKVSKIKDDLIPSFQKIMNKHYGSIVVYSAIKVSNSELYMLKVNGGVFYSNLSGTIVIVPGKNGSPKLVDLSGDVPQNLSANMLKPLNKQYIDEFSGGIIYKAKNEIAKVLVFTDPACAYCQKLHNNIDKYLDKGITIQYAPMPIFGKSSEEALIRAFSSDNPKASIDYIKNEFANRRGANIDWEASGLDRINPKMIEFVADGMKLGQKLGFNGTPGIVLSDGTLINGYLTADRLLSEINKINKHN